MSHFEARSKHTSGRRTGLTLVEVAVLLSVLGMLFAVAIPTLARAIRASKVAEASEQLNFLFRAAASYYAVARSDERGGVVHCLPDAAGPAPTVPSPTAIPVDFSLTPGAATWKALGFAPQAPLRYRYSFLPAAAGCSTTPDASAGPLLLRAEGDLDGDGAYSHFELLADLSSQGKLVLDPVLHIDDRIE
jgi:type II secretory pathway pseudopilin PulG